MGVQHVLVSEHANCGARTEIVTREHAEACRFFSVLWSHLIVRERKMERVEHKVLEESGTRCREARKQRKARLEGRGESN